MRSTKSLKQAEMSYSPNLNLNSRYNSRTNNMIAINNTTNNNNLNIKIAPTLKNEYFQLDSNNNCTYPNERQEPKISINSNNDSTFI